MTPPPPPKHTDRQQQNLAFIWIGFYFLKYFSPVNKGRAFYIFIKELSHRMTKAQNHTHFHTHTHTHTPTKKEEEAKQKPNNNKNKTKITVGVGGGGGQTKGLKTKCPTKGVSPPTPQICVYL